MNVERTLENARRMANDFIFLEISKAVAVVETIRRDMSSYTDEEIKEAIDEINLWIEWLVGPMDEKEDLYDLYRYHLNECGEIVQAYEEIEDD